MDLAKSISGTCVHLPENFDFFDFTITVANQHTDRDQQSEEDSEVYCNGSSKHFNVLSCDIVYTPYHRSYRLRNRDWKQLT